MGGPAHFACEVCTLYLAIYIPRLVIFHAIYHFAKEFEIELWVFPSGTFLFYHMFLVILSLIRVLFIDGVGYGMGYVLGNN